MSGICGVLRLDGAPAEGIGRLLARLGRRGPDGSRVLEDGPVALGHASLVTTPEARHEAMPLVDPATGCAITADVRLDNRAELLAALGLSPAGRVIGDGELILRAYIAWGEDCPNRLLGDFAFAIWDPRARRLFAARDQMGMKQLAFAHIPGRVLAFASEPRAVLEAEGVPSDLDEGRIADFLEDYLEMIDHDSTFYRWVKRLPPAHRLVAEAGGVSVTRYWSLETPPRIDLGRDEAYIEAFLDVFGTAVKDRLRSAGPVGAMLSGGLDSGSVVALASRQLAEAGLGPLPTFSLVGPDPDNFAETLAIRSSAGLPGLAPHMVDVADLGRRADSIRAALREIDEPFDGHMNLSRAVNMAVRDQGIRVLLDGVGGDLAFDPGNHRPALLRSGRLIRLWQEAVDQERFWGGQWPRWMELRRTANRALIPHALRPLARALRRRRHGRPGGGILSPAFAREVDLSARVARYHAYNGAVSPASRHWKAALLASPMPVVGRERYDRLAAGFGIEPRDPYMDRRVIAFCLSCPADQMTAGGWPKILLRRAMAGRLPEDVVWRRGRTHLGWSLTVELLGGEQMRLPELSGAQRRLFQRVTGLDYGQPPPPALPQKELWDLWYLALWLDSPNGPVL